MSEISETSFEELVVIQEKQENVPESSHLAAREEADRLSALDALAVRSGLTIAKQVIRCSPVCPTILFNQLNFLEFC